MRLTYHHVSTLLLPETIWHKGGGGGKKPRESNSHVSEQKQLALIAKKATKHRAILEWLVNEIKHL